MNRRLTMTILLGLFAATIVGAPAARAAQADAPAIALSAAASASVQRDGKSGVALILRVSAESASASDDGAGRNDRDRKRTEKIEIQTAAYGANAEKPVASQKTSLSVALASDDTAYEVHVPLPLPAGRYEIRVTAKSGKRTGTTSVDVDVPDFAGAPLAGSDMQVSVVPAPVSGPADAFGELIPRAPTSQRTFATSDRLTAFVRLYEGGDDLIQPVHVTTRLTTDAAQNVATELRTLSVSAFGQGRVADYQFPVPLERLTPRGYILTMEFSAGGASLTRTMRFTVR